MLKILWMEKRLNNREVFFPHRCIATTEQWFSKEKHLRFSDLFWRHGRRQRCFRRASCLGVKAHNLVGTGNDISHGGLSRKETCWKSNPSWYWELTGTHVRSSKKFFTVSTRVWPRFAGIGSALCLLAGLFSLQGGGQKREVSRTALKKVSCKGT